MSGDDDVTRGVATGSGGLVFLEDGYPPDGMNTPMLALGRAMAHLGVPVCRVQHSWAVRTLGRGAGRLGLIRNVVRLPGRSYLIGFGWPNDGRYFPMGYWREFIPWVCDCWPRDYAKWERLLRRNRTRLAFFSARGSTAHFRERLPRMQSEWLPEACDTAEYEALRPLAARRIGVLEIGRKLAAFHNAVSSGLAASGVRHVFSHAASGARLFPDQAALHAALADSVISVCFPRSVTHPDLAGGLETVTLRYFESIASGCVVLGRCPGELHELFGFNPVVEADLSDPVGQVREVLARLEEHQPMVERNLRRMHEVGTWAVRARAMLKVLGARGFALPRS